MEISSPFIVYLLIINFITLVVFGADKISAASDAWRVRERTLLLLALVGGSLGAIIAIKFFRHKTQKSSFLILLAVIFLAQLALLLWITNSGNSYGTNPTL